MFDTPPLAAGVEVQKKPSRGRDRYVVIDKIDDETLTEAAEKTAALSDADVEETKRRLVERTVSETVLSEVPPGSDVLVKARYDVEV